MNLYLLTRYPTGGYDSHDSMMVAAENECIAGAMSPIGTILVREEDWRKLGYELGWARNPDEVSITLLGKADISITERRVILASLNNTLIVNNESINNPPVPPLGRLIKDGSLSFCNNCGSSLHPKFIFWNDGCIQPACTNYFNKLRSQK